MQLIPCYTPWFLVLITYVIRVVGWSLGGGISWLDMHLVTSARDKIAPFLQVIILTNFIVASPLLCQTSAPKSNGLKPHFGVYSLSGQHPPNPGFCYCLLDRVRWYANSHDGCFETIIFDDDFPFLHGSWWWIPIPSRFDPQILEVKSCVACAEVLFSAAGLLHTAE